MSTTYIYNYNNYYNRQIKIENTIAEYGTPIHTQQGVNFNPNDGVNTTLIVGKTGNAYNGTGDYIIIADDDNNTFTRWYIIDHTRTLKGQYRLTVHRDLIADYKTEIIDAPVFIEKATLNDDDPFIFNSEDMTFNQIKQSETMLKDFTGCSWLVGYFARADGTGASKSYSANIISRYTPDIIVKNKDGAIATLDNWAYNKFVNGTFIGYPSSIEYTTDVKYLTASASDTQYFRFSWKENGQGSEKNLNNSNTGVSFSPSWVGVGEELGDGTGAVTVSKYWAAHNFYDGTKGIKTLINKFLVLKNPSEAYDDSNYWASEYNTTKFKNLDGKIIQYLDENGATVLKKINIKRLHLLSTVPYYINKSDSNALTLYNQWNSNIIATGLNVSSSGAGTNVYFFSLSYTDYTINLTEIDASETSSSSITLDIPTDRFHVRDAVYDMFCLPYSDEFSLYIKDNNQYQYIQMNRGVAMNIATGLATSLGDALYDLQLLPYCPIGNLQKVLENNYSFTDQTDADAYGYSLAKYSTGSIAGFIVYADRSAFTIDIPLDNPITVSNPKIDNLTKVYRLCSPNYQGVFEFSAAKNGGVESFNVDCNYIPVNPYIHINPNFKDGYLYGQDFNDSRGLICQGDFSLASVSAEWINYQMNNKNYEAAFNRQVESLELQNKIQKAKDITNAATGAVSGALTGLLTGGIGGAIAGGVASAAGGAADVITNDILRNDSLDLTKDQFAYNLGNIQARPQSIAKTTAYTYNNKVFPFLEYYTCTSQEVKALENKLKYNGMTVMRIGTISEFLKLEPTYIKGKLIRLESLSDDFHLLTSIADELNKGVFI